MDTSNLRQEYTQNTFDIQNANTDPFMQFEEWFAQCLEKNIPEPYAMALATVDKNKNPHVRMVLMRDFNKQGLCFFTNYTSAKSIDILHNACVEVLFFWQSMERQVRIQGCVSQLSAQENQSYFSKRPRASQISAMASPQSQIIENRAYLEHMHQKIEHEHASCNTLKCPDYWGGYRIVPNYFEFWQGRSSRLHDRICYVLTSSADVDNLSFWHMQRLAP
jgi:pyridoxamine 5'-phosphate oxidase